MRRNRERLIEDKYGEIHDYLWEKIDELGIEEAIDEEKIDEIALQMAEDYIQGLEEDYADYKREQERDERIGL